VADSNIDRSKTEARSALLWCSLGVACAWNEKLRSEEIEIEMWVSGFRIEVVF